MVIVKGGDALDTIAADVCIVGSGPVGSALALGLARRGHSVVVLESGLQRPGLPLSAAEIIQPAHHVDTSLASCRALGGTSWLWGGRCTPLEPVDFMRREHIGDDGWMIGASDLERYHSEAAKILGCEPAQFRLSDPSILQDETLSCNRLERWSHRPKLAQHLPDLGRGLPITIVIDATVIDIEFNDQRAQVTGLVVASETGRQNFRNAKIFVIACGGLETTRLLLNVQARSPSLFGGRAGPLGRYYMGHLSGKIARIHFNRSSDARIFDYRRDDASISRRRIEINLAAQLRARLPNAIFYPGNPSIADPDHRIGVLSAAFLALSVPAIGRRFVSEPIRLMNLAKKPRYFEHLRNIVLDMPRTAIMLLSLIRARLFSGNASSGLFLFDAKGVYPLHYHAEQLPDRDNRVELAETRDRFGLRQLRIDFRFRAEDAEGAVRAHEVLDQALQRANIGALVFDQDPADRPQAVLAQATDGFHQIGTTRMGRDARDGVVDRDCRVFGISNLFIAGTSIYRTSGAANPTFTAVALSLRLADHVGDLLLASPAQQERNC